jgi:hypothetical protein
MVRQDPERLRPFMVQPTVRPLETFTPTSNAIQRTEGFEAAAPSVDKFLETIAGLARNEQKAENGRVSEIGAKIGTRVAAGEEFNKVVSEYIHSGKTPRQLRADLAKASTLGDLSKLDNDFFVRNFEESVVRGRSAEAQAGIMSRLPEVIDAIEAQLAVGPGGDMMTGGEWAQMVADLKISQILESEQGDFFGELSEYGQTLGTQLLSDTVAKARAAATSEVETRASAKIVEAKSSAAFLALSDITSKITEDSDEDLDIDESVGILSTTLTQWWDGTLETGPPEERRDALLNLYTAMSRQIQIDVEDFDDQEEVLAALRETFLESKSGSGNKIFPEGGKAMVAMLEKSDAFLDETRREKAYAGQGSNDKEEAAAELFKDAFQETDWIHVRPEDQTPEQRDDQLDFIEANMQEDPSLGLRLKNVIAQHHSQLPRNKDGGDGSVQSLAFGRIKGNAMEAFDMGLAGEDSEQLTAFVTANFAPSDRGPAMEILTAQAHSRRDQRTAITSRNSLLASIAMAQKGTLITETILQDPDTQIEITQDAHKILAEFQADHLGRIELRHKSGITSTVEFREEMARTLQRLVEEDAPVQVEVLSGSAQEELVKETETVVSQRGEVPSSNLVWTGIDRDELARRKNVKPLRSVRDLEDYDISGPILEPTGETEDGEPTGTRITEVQYGGRALDSVYLQAAHMSRLIYGTDYAPEAGDYGKGAAERDRFDEAFKLQRRISSKDTQKHRKQLDSFLEDEILLNIVNEQNVADKGYGMFTPEMQLRLEKALVELVPKNPFATSTVAYSGRGHLEKVLKDKGLYKLVRDNPRRFPNLQFGERILPDAISYDLSKMPITAFRVSNTIKGSEYDILARAVTTGEFTREFRPGLPEVPRRTVMRLRADYLDKALSSSTSFLTRSTRTNVVTINPAELQQAADRNPVVAQVLSNAKKVYEIRRGEKPSPLDRKMPLAERAALGALFNHFLLTEASRSNK